MVSNVMVDRPASGDLISSAQADYDTLRHVSPEQSCPYLPNRMARSEAFWVDQLDPAMYQKLLARGFRRSGRIVYRPRCRSCRECRQMRVPVDQFAPSRSMRRIMKRNADLEVRLGPPVADEEKFELYVRYLRHQHNGSMARTFDAFREFLYDSPLPSIEFAYRLGDRLIGVSIADRVPDGLSSVYMFFDPAFAERSLGTFSVVWELEHCRREQLAYYYLGFFVSGCDKMSYKARFAPNEILVGDDRWVTLRV
jgi:arginine-tRNA-protein transferase